MSLKSSQDFKNVFSRPTWRNGKELLVLAKYNDLPHPRLGLAISKKSVKLATQRNRIRRVVKESFRHHKESIKGFDIVVLTRPGASDMNNQLIFKEMSKIWEKLITHCAKSCPP